MDLQVEKSTIHAYLRATSMSKNGLQVTDVNKLAQAPDDGSATSYPFDLLSFESCNFINNLQHTKFINNYKICFFQKSAII